MNKLPPIIFVTLITFMHSNEAVWTANNVQRLEGPYRDSLLTVVKSNNKATDHYGMQTSGSEYITIDESTGEIKQIKEFNYETKERHIIFVTAYNASNEQTEETISLLVEVLDKNDNIPSFSQSSLTGVVEEAHSRGSSSQPFMTIFATDADSGINAQIVYSIKEDVVGIPDSASGTRFNIDPISGAVRLSNSALLDYETVPRLTFVVVASDNNGNNPKHTSEAIVNVNVLDSNDHAPVFKGIPQSFSVVEVAPLDITLLDIFATDGDEGVNKKVYFAIRGGNTGGTFKVLSEPSSTGQSVGKLQLEKKLDFESGVTFYSLEIVAFNKEALNHIDAAYTTTASINVTVIDVNEPPTFLNTPYSATVTEGPLGYNGKPISLFTVRAGDMDFRGNQTVSYSLIDPEGWFAIDSKSGLVTLISMVDWEANSVVNGKYYLRAVATDNYDHGPPASQQESIEIIINDINDNPPTLVWGKDRKTVVMCEQPTSSIVSVITAFDIDSSENGPDFTFQFDDSVNTNQWGFQRDSGTSSKIIAKFTDYGLKSKMEVVALPFTITDAGTIPQTGRATLIVGIIKCNEIESTTSSGSRARFSVILLISAISMSYFHVPVQFSYSYI